MNARPAGLRLWLSIAVVGLPILLLVALGLQVRGDLSAPPSTHGSCLVDMAQRAAYLIDLRKPLDPDFQSLPGELLGAVSRSLPADTELGVYALSPYAEAPRTLIGRLCKPYDNDALVVASAKDHRGGEGDCDDIPAQVPASLRTDAARFCEEREMLRVRVDAFVAQNGIELATDAYLVEAIEETWRDFADSTVPTSLYLFSDMMQHAAWYSHLDTQWTEWDAETFAAARATRMPVRGGIASPGEDLGVKVFYVARTGMTDSQQPQLSHQRFWTDFFGAAVDVAFEHQPTMNGYPAEPRMDVTTPAEMAAYELERARHRSEVVARERAELESARRALAEREKTLLEQQRRLRESQQRFAAEQREFELRAEREQELNPGSVAELGEPGA